LEYSPQRGHWLRVGQSSGGKMIDLSPLSFIDYSVGNIINASGEVAGYTTTGSTTLATFMLMGS
jgi:hypothetical protein